MLVDLSMSTGEWRWLWPQGHLCVETKCVHNLLFSIPVSGCGGWVLVGSIRTLEGPIFSSFLWTSQEWWVWEPQRQGWTLGALVCIIMENWWPQTGTLHLFLYHSIVQCGSPSLRYLTMDLRLRFITTLQWSFEEFCINEADRNAVESSVESRC